MRQASLKFHGATGTVTGSRTRFRIGKKQYLVDCGLFQGPSEIRQRNWTPFPDIKSLSAVLLTHAHIDHSGYLPKIVQQGYSGPVYCSEATADLCRIMLLDAAHLQEEDARYANEARYSRHDPALPLYTTEDAERAIDLFRPVSFNHWHGLGDGVGFQLIRAGHILGSGYLQFQYSLGNGSRLLTFSGDIGNGRSYVLRDPQPLSETDDLVLESTYGDRVQPRVDPLDELELIVNRVIKRGGTLVIPAFTVGRTQELIYLLSELERRNRIPRTPLFVDSPMALDATEIYLRYPDELKVIEERGRLQAPFSVRDFHAVQSADESMLLCMNTDPKIVISAAGMLTGGRVLHHLKARLPDEKSGVLFVGYQAEGTKGRLLRHGLKSVRIHHRPVTVEAEVFSIDTLSAHADSDDLMAWLKRLKRPPTNIYINHGETQAARALCYRIRHELEWNARVAESDIEYHLGQE